MSSTPPVRIGIIGGSGLYDMAELTDREERVIETPFGPPSAPYVVATLRGQRVAFLARHGHGHRLSPSELNFRANICGFKALGVSGSSRRALSGACVRITGRSTSCCLTSSSTARGDG